MVGVAVDHVEQFVAEPGELLGRRTAGFVDSIGAAHHFVHHAVVDRDEQLFFRTDVVIERALAEFVGVAKFGDTRRVVAALGEDARRRVDDRFSARFPLRVTRHRAASAL